MKKNETAFLFLARLFVYLYLRFIIDFCMMLDFILRISVAGLMGALIGLEREYRAKEAGYRTHFLVSMGSALLMIVSQYGFDALLGDKGIGLDPSRIAAQVVTGIGFIGAGTIIINRQIDNRGRCLGDGGHRPCDRRGNVYAWYMLHAVGACGVGVAEPFV